MVLETIPRDALADDEALRRLQALLDSGVLAGQSGVRHARPHTLEESDLDKALEMRTSQDPMDWDEPRPFEYFQDAYESASERYLFDAGLGIKNFSLCSDSFRTYEAEVSAACLSSAKIAVQRFLDLNSIATSKVDQSTDILVNEIATDLRLIAKSAFFEPIAKNELLDCFLHAYEAGGFPCGWKGELPADGGELSEGLVVYYPQ